MASVRLTAALGVDGVVGEPARARHVRPGQLSRSPHARLVVCSTGAWRSAALMLPLHRLQRRRRLPDPAHQRARVPAASADRSAEQLLHASQAAEAAAPPDRPPAPAAVGPYCARLGASAGNAPTLTCWHSRTAHVQRLMLRDPQPHRRQLVHLSRSRSTTARVGERGLALRDSRWADAPPPHRASPPDAASPHDAPAARPPSCRSFGASSWSCASARHCSGGLPLLWLSLAAAPPAPARGQQAPAPAAAARRSRLLLGIAFFWRHASMLRLLRKSG